MKIQECDWFKEVHASTAKHLAYHKKMMGYEVQGRCNTCNRVKCKCPKECNHQWKAVGVPERPTEGIMAPGWFFQPWTCGDCQQVVPSRMQYHDCKGGTQP